MDCPKPPATPPPGPPPPSNTDDVLNCLKILSYNGPWYDRRNVNSNDDLSLIGTSAKALTLNKLKSTQSYFNAEYHQVNNGTTSAKSIFRTHKSFINLSYVQSIRNGRILLDNVELPYGDSYKEVIGRMTGKVF